MPPHRSVRRDNVCFLDLKRASWVTTYDYSYKPADFIKDQVNNLPVMMKVTDGYYGTNSINFTYSSEDIYLITHIRTQKRIIIKDRTGQLLSFPEDHKMQFYAVVDGKQESSTKSLGQIVDEHAMSAAKIQVKPIPGKSINFCYGAGQTHSMEMDIFDWETTYEERYMVGNSVAYERMSTTATIIPVWMPISLTAATGFTDGSFEDYRKFMDEMKRATEDFENSKATGLKEIMLFEGKLSDYAEGTYDMITPFDYGTIGQFRRATSVEHSSSPPPKPPLKPRSKSDAHVKQRCKPRIEPPSSPSSTAKPSILKKIFQKSKSADSAKQPSYEPTHLDEESGLIQDYTALEFDRLDPYADIDKDINDSVKRPLPEIPKDEKRKQKNDSRSAVKSFSKAEKKPSYEPVDIDQSNTPRIVPESKPAPPLPQEGSLYGDYSDLPQSLEGMSVSEVAECLKILKMSRHIDRFKDEDVDGSLLNALSKEILMEDFDFTEFEVTKLMKFKRGWRPKTAATMSV